ncbi:MAG TPA: YceI family protein [Pseudonocardia sp.]|jgi:polyisoprenoid-binding protein YceI
MTSEHSTISSLTKGTWALDAAHTSVTWSIGHLGISLVRGRFNEVDAQLVIAEDGTHSVTATINTASLDSGNEARDQHVLSAELLDVAKRPTLSYRSTKVVGDGPSLTVDGELTIGDVTRPVPLTVELGGVQGFYDGTTHGGFAASAEIRRSDFGLNFGPADGMLGQVVKIQLDLEFIEPA